MTWKQFWCKHIWNNIGDEIKLRTIKERESISLGAYHTYTYYGINQKCLKCDKEKIHEKRKIHL